MSNATLNLCKQAIILAHSDHEGTEQFNAVLDKLERKLPQDEFYAFAAGLFGENK